jgi:predicted ATPase
MAGTPTCALRPDEVIDLLAALVDKSLLEVSVQGRYRMLETVRAYAAERLDEPARRPRRSRCWAAPLAARAHPAHSTLSTGCARSAALG